MIDKLVKSYPDAGEITLFYIRRISQKEMVMIAKNWEADLIVMGTHGRTGLSYLILGSVSRVCYQTFGSTGNGGST